MLENITEVIGFDLGHGETALSRLYLAGLSKDSDPDLIEMFGKKNQITAIGYHPKRGVLIGESALTPGVEELHTIFKRKPNGDPVYQRVMHDYIKTIYETQIEQGRINENESFFIVGCPSAWTQDPTIVTDYEKLFLDAGIQQVKVVAESRAAYIHAIEKGTLKMAESKGSVVVIDLGSSTTDITLINQISSSIPIDVGRELGAAAIDKAIFQWVLQNHPDRDELTKIFSDYPIFRHRCELHCRRVKEVYFSAPEDYEEPEYFAGWRPETIQGKYLFTAEINSTVMNEILNTPFVELEGEFQTWPMAFANELIKLKQQLELRQQLDSSKVFTPGVILLTGGASRMNFVPETCKKIFPQAVVKLDDSPEFSIARGLARWGRVEINTSQFSKDVERFCLENITPRVANQIDSLYESIAGVLADRVISIIKKNFSSWKDRTYLTIEDMQYQVDKEVKDLLQEKNLEDLIGMQIRPILDEITKELRADIKGLENKYCIPIGNLGSSFDFKNTGIKNLSLNHQPEIDATDGMISGLSSVVGWIAGILITVVAWVIRPILVSITYATFGVIITAIAGWFVANPVFWGFLATVGIVIVVTGDSAAKVKQQAQEAIEKNMPTWNLPLWIRKLVKVNSVYAKIDEQHQVIIAQVTSKLKEEDEIRQELTDKITSVFENSLKQKAEEMRTLIG